MTKYQWKQMHLVQAETIAMTILWKWGWVDLTNISQFISLLSIMKLVITIIVRSHQNIIQFFLEMYTTLQGQRRQIGFELVKIISYLTLSGELWGVANLNILQLNVTWFITQYESKIALFRLWTHKRHPILCPYGQAMWHLFGILWRKDMAKYLECTGDIIIRVLCLSGIIPVH